LNAFKASHVEQLKGIQLWMEPGRYIVADAAVLLVFKPCWSGQLLACLQWLHARDWND